MDNFLNLYNSSLTELSSVIIVINILITFVLALVIVRVYQKTHRGISYSQSFVMAMVMLGILAAIAMMILSNNLVRALGVLGIFALIRFRTILKDTKDIAYLFFVLAIGMAIGTNNYIIGFIGTLMLSAIILLLNRYNFGSFVREGFLLTFITDGGFAPDAYKKAFDDSLISSKLLQIKGLPDGEQEYYFSVRFKNPDQGPGNLVSQLKSLAGIKLVELITGKDATEY